MVKTYTLKNDRINLTLLNVGAAVYDCQIKSPTGWQSVVFQPLHLASYFNNPEHFGATVGPVANRIAGAQFTLNQRRYFLDNNEGENHLHGGEDGLSFKIFTLNEQSEQQIAFSLQTAHRHYPGVLTLVVRYVLTHSGFEIHFDYESSEDCPINITNHCYFNLCKQSGSVLGHKIGWQEAKIWYNDEQHIPQRLCPCYEQELTLTEQLLNSYIQTSDGVTYRVPDSPISLQVNSSYPGFMCYNSFYAGQTMLTDGQALKPYAALCIEPQFVPNDINMQQACLSLAGVSYHQWISYQFSGI